MAGVSGAPSGGTGSPLEAKGDSLMKEVRKSDLGSQDRSTTLAMCWMRAGGPEVLQVCTSTLNITNKLI